MVAVAPRRPLGRSRGAGGALTFVRRLRRDPAIPLTLSLGVPGLVAAAIAGVPEDIASGAAVSVLAALAQWLTVWLNRRVLHLPVRTVRLVRLGIALLLAAILIELIIPASVALYIPVVGIAAAVGRREGLVIGGVAMVLYLLPAFTAVGPLDRDHLARATAAAAVTALVAGGARYVVGNLERSTVELREARRRERRRVRQIAGIEEVGRGLAAGPTAGALAGVMDVLVERFGYRFVSIYLARPDGLLELGAQRGYSHTIETFDGTFGIVGRIMRTRQAELVEDVSKDPDYAAAIPGVVSEISAPLLVAEEFLGIVNVESVDGSLDPTDLRLVVAVADRLAAYVALGRERQRLADLAIRDPLTGLHNRRFLDDTLARMFAARERVPAERRDPIAVTLFDLDHFGALNKRHGLAAGDAALKRFGQLLAEKFRQADIVARYGGEEFLVVLINAGVADAERRANDVRLAFEAGAQAAAGMPPVTVSAGCAAIKAGDDGGRADLLGAADVALTMAKRSGRNCVVSAG